MAQFRDPLPGWSDGAVKAFCYGSVALVLSFLFTIVLGVAAFDGRASVQTTRAAMGHGDARRPHPIGADHLTPPSVICAALARDLHPWPAPFSACGLAAENTMRRIEP